MSNNAKLAHECPIIQKFQFFNLQFGIGSNENPRQVPQFWLKAQKNQAMALGIRFRRNREFQVAIITVKI